MKTLEREIAQFMDEVTPAGSKFVVTVIELDHMNVYGPFDSWKEAADWNNERWAGAGTVYPLFYPAQGD